MTENKINELKEKILSNEEKKDYKSEKFDELKLVVKDFLNKQNADEALNMITFGSLELGSSDIHYDNSAENTVIRFRIDGVLVDIFTLTKLEYKKILERIKYGSALKLNIVDTPQDGKYSIKRGEKKLDIRVSTLPTKYGENVVSRVLDSESAIIDFDKLGFFWTSKRMLEKSIKKRNGMILVTGPTGSGKTTTLYTILNELNSRDKKIITLEDPIEYEMPGVIQSEINEKKKYTFEKGLKALLRQDPDIIMLGEIRDFDTLNIATNASLTGHLVLSTLHTKSAADTLDRIINMGLKPYIIASALDTIVAQRLVRKICNNCKKEVEKTPNENMLIKKMMNEIGMNKISTEHIKLFRGEGCSECNHSGYKGRIGIYEIITLNDKIKDIIREGGSSEEIIEEAKKGDMISMKEDGILKSIKGYTTIEEILRVI